MSHTAVIELRTAMQRVVTLDEGFKAMTAAVRPTAGATGAAPEAELPALLDWLAGQLAEMDRRYLIGCIALTCDPAHDALAALLAEQLGLHPSPDKPGVAPLAEPFALRASLSPSICVHGILRDQAAALLPVELQQEPPYTLLATGPWCYVIAPAEGTEPAPEEVSAGVEHFVGATGRLFRGGRFAGGLEYDVWCELIQMVSGVPIPPPVSEEHYSYWIRTPATFLFPGVAAGTGPFPRSRSCLSDNGRTYPRANIMPGPRAPAALREPMRAHIALNAALAMQAYEWIRLMHIPDNQPIVVTGNLSDNYGFLTLLASFFNDKPVIRTTLAGTVALGAALRARAEMTGVAIGAFRGMAAMEPIDTAWLRIPNLLPYYVAYSAALQKLIAETT